MGNYKDPLIHFSHLEKDHYSTDSHPNCQHFPESSNMKPPNIKSKTYYWKAFCEEKGGDVEGAWESIKLCEKANVQEKREKWEQENQKSNSKKCEEENEETVESEQISNINPIQDMKADKHILKFKKKLKSRMKTKKERSQKQFSKMFG